MSQQHLGAACTEFASDMVGNRGKVDDTGAGNAESVDADCGRLEFADLARSKTPQRIEAVRTPPPFEFVKRSDLRSAGRYDHFARSPMGNPGLGAELVHLPRSLYCQAGLERSRAVVETGVNDTAVVATLVEPDPVFLFEDEERGPRATFEQSPTHRQAHKPPAHYARVVSSRHRLPRVK